jgi:malonyl CoA-acyl carrier protein transacylase
MGGELFDRYADWTSAADAVLGYSIRELCLDDPRGELVRTAFTQPALYVVNAMMFRARTDAGAAAPSFVAGHSLGEYDALLVAGVFDFATGLRLVQRRGQLMGTVSGGGMAAVIGLTPQQIEAILQQSEAGRRVDVANFNSFDQTVLAGPKEDLTEIGPAFESAGARAFIPLNVSAPFHSRYMRDAQAEFAGFLAGVTFNAPAIPVISNVTGRPYESTRVRDTLSEQIGNSVRWLDSMRYLLDQPGVEFEEVGPGKVLGKLLAQIRKAGK